MRLVTSFSFSKLAPVFDLQKRDRYTSFKDVSVEVVFTIWHLPIMTVLIVDFAKDYLLYI